MVNEEKRTILVFGEKTFKIEVPIGSKVTFSPWSPPGMKTGGYQEHSNRGTLRIYEKGEKSTILGVFSGVTSFRDSMLQYSEEIVVERGATIWHSDEHGYSRESQSSGEKQWVNPLEEHPALKESQSIEDLIELLDEKITEAKAIKLEEVTDGNG